MADTTSIASRMEKLAKLKRMKQGLSASSVAEEPVSKAPDADAGADAPTLRTPGASALSAASPEFSPVSAEAPDEGTGAQPTLDDLLAETSEPAPSVTDEDDFVAAFNDDPAEESTASGTSDFQMLDAAEETDLDDISESELPADLMETSEGSLDDVAAQIEDEADAFTMVNNDAATDASETEATQTGQTARDASAAETADAVETATTEEILDATDTEMDDDTRSALDELAALAGVGAVGVGVGAAMQAGEAESSVLDFSAKEIDPEILMHEFDHEQAPADAPTASELADGRVSVTFDESRTTLLDHVSRQMSCSVEDVVVTALDWYLDALFGEDGEAKTG